MPDFPMAIGTALPPKPEPRYLTTRMSAKGSSRRAAFENDDAIGHILDQIDSRLVPLALVVCLYGDHRRHAFGADPFIDAGKLAALQKFVVQTAHQQINAIEDDIAGPGFGLARRQTSKQAGQVEGAASNGVDGKPGIDQRQLMLRHRVEAPIQSREVASDVVDQFFECHEQARLARRRHRLSKFCMANRLFPVPGAPMTAVNLPSGKPPSVI